MQSCAGDEYGQIIVIADGIVQLKMVGTHNATALELCKAMQKMWQIAGYNDDKEEDDNNDKDSKQLETLLGAVKQKPGRIKRDASTATRKAIGHCTVLTRERKADQKRTVLRLRPELTKQGPSAAIVESLVMLRAAARRNTRTRPRARAPQKVQECS
jgi:hypothetical protein